MNHRLLLLGTLRPTKPNHCVIVSNIIITCAIFFELLDSLKMQTQNTFHVRVYQTVGNFIYLFAISVTCTNCRRRRLFVQTNTEVMVNDHWPCNCKSLQRSLENFSHLVVRNRCLLGPTIAVGNQEDAEIFDEKIGTVGINTILWLSCTLAVDDSRVDPVYDRVLIEWLIKPFHNLSYYL